MNGVLVAIPPPPGYLVDFDNPQRRSVMSTYIVSGIGLAVSTFFMAQKLYVKGVLRNTFGLDDGMICHLEVLSMVTNSSTCSISNLRLGMSLAHLLHSQNTSRILEFRFLVLQETNRPRHLAWKRCHPRPNHM